MHRRRHDYTHCDPVAEWLSARAGTDKVPGSSPPTAPIFSEHEISGGSISVGTHRRRHGHEHSHLVAEWLPAWIGNRWFPGSRPPVALIFSTSNFSRSNSRRVSRSTSTGWFGGRVVKWVTCLCVGTRGCGFDSH